MKYTIVKEIEKEIKNEIYRHQRDIAILFKDLESENKEHDKKIANLEKLKEDILKEHKQAAVFLAKLKKTKLETWGPAKRLITAQNLLKLWGIRYFCDKSPKTCHRSIKPHLTLTPEQQYFFLRLADKVSIRRYADNVRLYYGEYDERTKKFVVTRYIFNTTV